MMLVGPERAAFAFLFVQLRRLGPRGHKLNGPKRQSAPFRSIHLMLVGPDQAAFAFLCSAVFFVYVKFTVLKAAEGHFLDVSESPVL